jgi:hypothetical protein
VVTALGPLPFLFAACATALVLGLAPHLVTTTTAAAPSGVALAACAAFLPYGCLLGLTPPSRRLGIVAALLLALGAGLALCSAPALLSDDVYRQVWDGKLLAHRVDPYAFAPDSPALVDLRDGDFSRINHASVPTIYPPLAQGAFALGYLLHPSPFGQRLLALGLHLGCALLVFGWLQRADAARARPGHAVRAATLLALNPLALLESALNGHFDLAVGGLVVAFLWALPRPALATAALAAASALKLVGVVLLPLLWRRSRSACLVAAALAALCVAPLSGAGASGAAEASGLRHYASRWQGNAALFGVIERGSALAVDGLARLSGQTRTDAPLTTRPGQRADEVHVPWAAPVLQALAGTAFDLRPIALVEHKAPRPTDVLPRGHVAGLLARLIALGLFAALLVKLHASKLPPTELARLSLFGVLLLAPQLHPWYLLWLLPLELALGRHSGLLWSALALGAYAFIDHWVGSRHWIELPWFAPLQTALVLCALGFEARSAGADLAR